MLFDRSKWQVPMIERRVRDWDLGLRLRSARECRHPEVQAYIRDRFLPEFFAEFAAIVEGRIPDWGIAPDELFIRSLESHIDWPVMETRDFLALEYEKDKDFAGRFQSWMADEMQWTFDPSNIEDWRATLERAARTLCYVFCNRAIFYEAIRARYPENLPRLVMPKGRLGDWEIYEHFRERFARAVRETGDYEPIFYPHVKDWAGALVFASESARQGWDGVLTNLGEYDFRQVPHDIVGGIFQKLISPEERQKFGQYFTDQDIVDIINAFCIRRAGDSVLDPACGSGSFLVRAYHRKAWLSEQKTGGIRHQDHQKYHQELLREIFGCDIALFAAHLATLNLAARRIEDEENYPCIARGNFFEVAEARETFCQVPGSRIAGDHNIIREHQAVKLPDLDAVIGNPPYVRQELITKAKDIKRAKGEAQASYESRLKNTKEHMQQMCSTAWSGLKLAGRSDLHCYFWPVAAKMLKEGGYFGFLTSSSWLDVEYGFVLQAWILQNFKVICVIESLDEPWFEDARVKTAITILQRTSYEKSRNENVVKFVRLLRPVKEILGERALGHETARQKAAEGLRKLIEKTRRPHTDENLRIIPVPQARLWNEGVEAGLLLGKGTDNGFTAEENGDDTGEDVGRIQVGDYAAGKWGRFLRAPDLYFRLMKKYGHRFVKLGEIAEVRRGITSGCDAFFMPRDVTARVLEEHAKGLPWNDVGLMKACKLIEVESGKVRIVRAGDNTLHPIESEYLRAEVHSLMQVSRPVIRAEDTNRVVLWVDAPLQELAGTYVAKYIRWGSKRTFESRKSKAVPVPKRSTCANRPLWYNLTNAATGVAFWPMAQQYRHIVPSNPENLVCNHNLFYLSNLVLDADALAILPAILNSTVLGLFKTYYGRYAGTEGNLKTEVIDVNLLDVPDPRSVSKSVSKRLLAAFASMQRRDIQHLVEEELMACHTPEHAKELASRPIVLSAELHQPDRLDLDDGVLQVLGVEAPQERRAILKELYEDVAKHFRQIRVVEIQKQEQRAGAGGRRFSAEDLAGSIWDSLPASERGAGLEEWLKGLAGGTGEAVEIPDGKAKANGADHLFDPSSVIFVHGNARTEVSYRNVEQAALAAMLAELEIRGQVRLPKEGDVCKQWVAKLQERLSDARARFQSWAGSRTGTAKLEEQTVDLLMQWFIHGRPG